MTLFPKIFFARTANREPSLFRQRGPVLQPPTANQPEGAEASRDFPSRDSRTLKSQAPPNEGPHVHHAKAVIQLSVRLYSNGSHPTFVTTPPSRDPRWGRNHYKIFSTVSHARRSQSKREPSRHRPERRRSEDQRRQGGARGGHLAVAP